MSKKWMSIPFAILCVLLLLFSCDNLGHIAPSSDAIPETNGIVSSAANIHYTEDALDLKPENILSWEAESAELILQDTSIPEAGQYVYTGISENFPYGALKKIVTVDSSALKSSAEVRLITENAAITDIISEGTFTAKGNISIDGDAELLSPDGSIVFIEEDESPLFVYNSEAELVRKFAISYDIADKASIRGTAKVELFLDFLLDIKWGKVETFSVSISPDVLFNISVTGVLDEEYRKYLGTLYFPPIVMGPVVLVPSIDLYLKTHFEGKIAWGGDFHATLDAGIRYSRNTWTPFADINADGSLNDLKMNGRTEAAFGPEVALKLYGLAGPYFALQGYVSANGTISTAKQSIDFEGTAGARGRLGGKLEILGKHFADLDFDLFDVHKGITLSSVFYETPAIQGSFSYPPIHITQGDSIQSAPVWANAPPDQKLTYSNSTSLPDGIKLDPLSGIISVSSTALQSPEQVFSISAVGIDGFSGIITGTLSISIAAPPMPAIQGSFSYPPISITQGDSAQSAPVWANAPPDQKLTYSNGVPLPDGITLDPLSGIISVSSTALQSPERVFSISAVGIDGFSGIITGTQSISIAAPPMPAIQGSFSYPLIRITQGDSAQSAPVWANAPPDQKFTYSSGTSMPDGIKLDPLSGIISVSSTALQSPEQVFSISAIGIDGFSGIITGTLSISIAAPPMPAIQGSFSYPPIRITQGDSAQSAPVWANAPPDQKFTYSNGVFLPDGITLDPLSGIISVSSTALQSPEQVFSISAVGTDGFSGIITGTLSISIAAPPMPAIQGSFSYPPISITQGDSAQSAPVWANAPPDQKFTYSNGTPLPDGINLDPLSGIISVSSTALQSPERVFSISAVGTDGFSGTITGTLSISIAAPPMPAIQGSFSYPPIRITQGDSAQSAPVWANAPPDQKFTYSSGTPLPDGIKLDPLSGIISVSSTALQSPEQVFSISAVGIDGFSGIITGTLSISIAAPLIPAIQGSFSYPPIRITQGDSAKSTPVWANAPPDQKFTYSNGVSLPDGITLDPLSGIISVSSTALQIPERVFSISAVGIDGFSGIITGTLSIAIAAPPIPAIQGSFSYPPISITQGDSAQSAPVWANAPPDQKLTYSNGTPLPDGIKLNPLSGIISVSSTALQSPEQVFSISAVGIDGFSGIITGTLSISIAAPPMPPEEEEHVPPDTPGELRSTGKTTASISLAWNSVAGTSAYELRRNNEVIYNGSGNSYTDSGLSKNTAYTYTVRAKNTAGLYSDWSPSLHIRSAKGPDLSISARIAEGASTVQLGNRIKIEFSVYNNGDMESDPTEVKYYSSDDSSIDADDDYLWSENLDSILPENSRNAYLSIAPETRYYGAILESESGDFNTSNNASDGLLITAYLAIPGGLTETSTSSSSISMTWNSVTGASAYELRRDRNLVYSGSSTSYTDSGLSSAAEYSYDVRAMNLNDTPGSWSPIVNVWTDLAAPAAPGNLHATDVGSSSISMTWNPVPGASAYELRRDRNLVYSGSSTSYTDSGLLSAAEYSYDVRAMNLNDTPGSWSPTVNVWTDLAAPAAPDNLRTTHVDSSSISMTWDPVPGASAYELRRDKNLVYRGSSTSYTDSGLSSAAEYSYDVRAMNTAGSSNWSSELNVRSKIADYVSDSSDNAKEMSGSYSELTEYLHAGDEDWYKIYVPYRIWPYTLRVYTTGETDTKGSLYGVNLFGNRESTPRKTHDDIDYPENKNFSISEIVQIGGWFYIQVTGTNNNTSGYYRIVLSY